MEEENEWIEWKKERMKEVKGKEESHSMVISFVWAYYLSEYSTQSHIHTVREWEEKMYNIITRWYFWYLILITSLTYTHMHNRTDQNVYYKNRIENQERMNSQAVSKSVRTRKVQTRIIIICYCVALFYDVKRCGVQYFTARKHNNNGNNRYK